jgi:predicted NUDIX family phosphoesterase
MIKESRNNSEKEKIVCFPREVMSRYPMPLEKFFYNRELWQAIMANLCYSYRDDAEKNNELKQVIAYAAVKAGNSYLAYTRTPKGGESQLHLKRSIGLGGHINLDDKNYVALEQSNSCSGMDLILTGVRREIKEEVEIGAKELCEPKLLGFISDDSNPVGLRHFGVVWLLEIAEPKVLPRDEAISEVSFYDLQELRKKYEEFETWSQLVINRIAELRDQ